MELPHWSWHTAAMTEKKPKRPRDPAQLAKLMVDIATGEVEDREMTPEERGKDPAASAMAAGVTGKLWEIGDIVALVEAADPKPGKRGPYRKQVAGGTTDPR